MKRPVLYGTVALTLACASSVFAQDFTGLNRQFDNGAAPTAPTASRDNSGLPIQPLLGVSPDTYSKDQAWYLTQDQGSLGSSAAPVVTRPLSLESQLRSNATPFLKAATASSFANRPFAMLCAASHAPAKELNFALSLLAAMYRSESEPAAGATGKVDLAEYALGIRHRIHDEPAKLLEIVAAEIEAHPDRVCEIVKAAIKGSDTSAETVASIVEKAATSRPESMRLAAQCAVAAVPESLQDVQAVLAKLDPASGNLGGSKDAKDSKDSKDAKGVVDPEISAPSNPLNLPPPPPPIPPVPPPPPPTTRTNLRPNYSTE